MPSGLTEAQADAWREIVAEASAVKLDLTGHAHTLERYAIAKANWRKCAAEIETEGQLMPTENGWQRNPRMVDFTGLGRLLQQLSAALGLTAATVRVGQASTGGSAESADNPPAASAEPPVADPEEPELIFQFPSAHHG